jgi:hypothetical protein
VNDLGFAVRTDRQDLQAVVSYAQNRPGTFWRNWGVDVGARTEFNYEGDRIQSFAFVSTGFRHLDFWRVNVFAQENFRAYDDRSTRGGPIMIREANHLAGFGFSSDPRRAVVGSLNGSVTDGEFGGDSWDVGASVTVRTSPRWNLTVGPYYSRGRVAAQYVGTMPEYVQTGAADSARVCDPGRTFGRCFAFAPLDFTHLNATVRLNVTFAPRLTLEVYVQPLIFASDYGTVGSLEAPRTFRFTPLLTPFPSIDNTVRSLRGNAVLRWEWRPGSTIYLAWQQTRFGFGDDGHFELRRDPRALFQTEPDNIVVLKGTYWLSL